MNPHIKFKQKLKYIASAIYLLNLIKAKKCILGKQAIIIVFYDLPGRKHIGDSE